MDATAPDQTGHQLVGPHDGHEDQRAGSRCMQEAWLADFCARFGRRGVVDVPVAGTYLGLGRSAAYQAAQRGELPTLRFGRRLVVPVPSLLRLLAADRYESAPAGDHQPPDGAPESDNVTSSTAAS